jgi:hypothetical protein
MPSDDVGLRVIAPPIAAVAVRAGMESPGAFIMEAFKASTVEACDMPACDRFGDDMADIKSRCASLT